MIPAPKRPGRPRDESIDGEITSALFELVEEVGLLAVTIEAIAERAGVSKATIYRRWDSKEELIVDAVAGLVVSAVEFPELGDIREQMVTGLRRIHSFMSETTAGVVFPWLIGEVARGSVIGRRYAECVIIPRRQMVQKAIGEAIKRGEIRSDLDLDLAVDMLIGPLILKKLMGALRRDDPNWAENLVDALLQGWNPKPKI